MASLHRPYSDHGVATKLPCRSIAFFGVLVGNSLALATLIALLWISCWQFSALSRRFQGTHNACTVHSQFLHCADGVLKT